MGRGSRPAFPGRAAVLAILASAAASCADRPDARHHRIAIEDVAFRPDTLVASVGDTVTWSNQDIVWHTVSAGDGGGPWQSGDMERGAAFTVVLPVPGTIRYTCRYHPTMNGVLVVR